MNIFAVHFSLPVGPLRLHMKQSTNSDADCDSNSPSTGARLHLWSWTSFLVPLWSRQLNSETGGPERAAPSRELGRKLERGNE